MFHVLSHYDLLIEHIWGWGYEGADNMQCEWDILQALFFKDFSFAYYVYCLAYKLQLALVVVFTEVKLVHQFF